MMTTDRFWIISAHAGLIGSRATEAAADALAVASAVNTGRPVHLHDRMTEVTA